MVGLVVMLATPRRAEALIIVPHFDAGVTAGDQTFINNAIAFYTGTFTDPITINIEFHFDAGVFGQSFFPVYNVPYANYRTALLADAKTADDATADPTLPAALPSGGLPGPNISIKPANGLAVGLATSEVANLCTIENAGFYAGAVSGCIGFGIHSTDLGGALISVLEHEIDEIMGLGSGLEGNGTIFGGRAMPEDLFRWASAGTRSFALNPSCTGPDGEGPLAYFSIDGGVTNLDSFHNCTTGADYGDWITHTPSQVQDAVTNLSAVPTLNANSAEVRALDVIGWDRAVVNPPPVPEPMSLVLFGSGLLAGAAARRRARRK
jgi:hypothetical protein